MGVGSMQADFEGVVDSVWKGENADYQHFLGVLRGSVVKCFTRNPGVLG